MQCFESLAGIEILELRMLTSHVVDVCETIARAAHHELSITLNLSQVPTRRTKSKSIRDD